ncbi:MAG: hypothetical protein JW902_07715, partial [Syntrophaceae bacterium]|nr:hypothetical protein [Syntrophaceae bacterium]
YPEQWKIRVDGVEIWKEYVERLPWLKQFYNRIYIGDIYELIDKLPRYELIIAGDVIEHLPKNRGQEIIRKCIRLARRKFILSIPVGDWTDNKIVANNPYEAHRSVWWARDLIRIGKEELGIPIKTYAHEGIRGGYCVAIYDKAKRGEHEWSLSRTTQKARRMKMS